MAPSLDELVFRAQERLEIVQTQLSAGAIATKEYVNRLQQIILEAWNNPALQEALVRASENAHAAGQKALEAAKNAIEATGVRDLPSPTDIARHVNAIFKDRLWRKTAFVFMCGVACGSVVGVSFGYCWGSRIVAVPHYRALHSLKDGSAVVVEDSVGATVKRPTDVVVKVRAFSIQPEDRAVLNGRARRLRELCKNNSQVTIGRSFSGVVTEMGPAVTRLDIGDEVWGALAEWEGGAAHELLVCPAHRLGRSPRALPPEAAASLPHSGALALYNLHQAGLGAHNTKGKRVLILGAGSGPGCVMLQLLKAWGASITAVCDPRARPLVTALGAQEVIGVDWCDDAAGIRSGAEANSAISDQLYKELDASAGLPWDAALVCRAPPPSVCRPPPRRFLRDDSGGCVRDMRPQGPMVTDSLPRLMSAFYGMYITFRRALAWARGIHTDLDFLLPVPLDAGMLDRIAAHVETGNLQTVVDKVYALQDFELALAHACSVGAIGCTVVRMS